MKRIRFLTRTIFFLITLFLITLGTNMTFGVNAQNISHPRKVYVIWYYAANEDIRGDAAQFFGIHWRPAFDTDYITPSTVKAHLQHVVEYFHRDVGKTFEFYKSGNEINVEYIKSDKFYVNYLDTNNAPADSFLDTDPHFWSKAWLDIEDNINSNPTLKPFNDLQNIYLVLVQSNYGFLHNGNPDKGAIGIARINGGKAMVALGGFETLQDKKLKAWADEEVKSAIAHELGHIFGLWHDFNTNGIMSYDFEETGGIFNNLPLLGGTHLSDRSKDWLSVHPDFSDNPPAIRPADNPLKMKVSRQPFNKNNSGLPPGNDITMLIGAPQYEIFLQLDDIDGLHQVELISPMLSDVCCNGPAEYDSTGRQKNYSLAKYLTLNGAVNMKEVIDITQWVEESLDRGEDSFDLFFTAIDKQGNISSGISYTVVLHRPTLVVAHPWMSEGILAGATVILELKPTEATYMMDISTIKEAVTVDGIEGVTIDTDKDVERISDNEIKVTLDFDGTDFDTISILSLRVAADAIEDYTGDELTAEIIVTARKETLSVTTASPLTEVTLNENLVTLTLTDAAFDESIFKIQQAVTVDGIKDVTINPNNITRISDNEITVKLDFDGTDFDTNATLTFSVAADAIVNYTGDKLSAKKSVTARKETLSAITVSPLTEATLNENVVTLILSGATYEADISKITDAVKVSGIEGVSLDITKIQRLSDRRITVALNFNGTDFYRDTLLTFNVEADAITNYKGAALITEVPVTASRDESLLKMYWTDYDRDKIQRANLDGSHVEDLVTRTQGLRSPYGIALDVEGGKMYWADVYTNKIQRANLDGSHVEDLVTRTKGLRDPRGIALDLEGGKMYWTDRSTDKIQRANLDGSHVEDLVPPQGRRVPSGIALDVEGGKMYWTTEFPRGSIQRANLDGTNKEYLIIISTGNPSGIALDVKGGKMYWIDMGPDKIRRANLDGSHVEDLVTGRSKFWHSEGLALDVEGGKMYWTEELDDKIQRANLDGSHVEDLVTRTQGLGEPRGIAIGIFSPINPIIVKEDVNRDGRVDIHDLVSVALQYGKTGTDIAADVNGDEVVNVDDFILVAAAVDTAAAAPAARAQVQSHFTAAQLQQWLTEARASGNTSHTYKKGVTVLEQLLALVAPKETALLPNYPNPFNPETWIPYQLAEPAVVTLTIYDTQGRVVRALDLGHQPIGTYEIKSRAVYWDGKNAVGEPVASGVYFYTFKADDFSVTRKMLIRK